MSKGGIVGDTSLYEMPSELREIIRDSIASCVDAHIPKVKIKRLHPSAVIPSYATDGSGCFDITAVECVEQKGNSAVYTTGLAFELPPGKVLMIYSRSGHGFNRGIRLANCVGVIDSDYRGEVAVKLTRDNHGIWFPAAGDRIAQGLIQDAEQVRFVEVEELSDTARGTGGFGSTG